MHSMHRTTKWIVAAVWVVACITAVLGLLADSYQKHYSGKIYPNVTIGGISFAGQTPYDVKTYWLTKNNAFPDIELTIRAGDSIATVSGSDLAMGYDATLSAVQAYGVGRTPYWLSNVYTIISQQKINLTPYFRWNWDPINSALDTVAADVHVPEEDALFQFENGKVTAFRPSKDGKTVNIDEAKQKIQSVLTQAAYTDSKMLLVEIPVVTIHPKISTDKANTFGIKERIGRGYSEFAGSIPGRIHNVALAASRINGVLIKPGDTFSFNETVGDISAATGYQSAYIIKDGRTVLGDGGGVCQVSSTLFRAALSAGLPIVERHAHAYRVHYYEEGGYAPGLDATVYSPSYDLKFKNDTPGYILIQTKTDTDNLTLTFEFYGTGDGRTAQILNQKLWGITPPPPDLFQDDPTLAKGVVKQVDFAAWGAKASFDYKVTRGQETLEDTTFYSNFQPWQAVYLRGTL